MHQRIFSRVYIVGAAALFFIALIFIFAASRAPAGFVQDTLIHVDKSATLSSIATELKSKNVIRSTTLFRIAVSSLGKTTSVGAGDFFFQTPPSVWQVAYRLVHDEEGLTPVRATFPEGTSVRGMSVILGNALNVKIATTTFSFSVKDFLSLASTSEGYLFPDTYFFPPNMTPAGVVATMREVFNQKIETIAPLIARSGRSRHDVVIMASILEKEALTDSDRRIIAGILWKRIDAGQPLQIDPPFAYALGKTSDQLTLVDLRINSPYNTYINKGLPPTPINNPGIAALTDAVTASTTPYWYYLSDKKGVIHYAATYGEHLANRVKYLGK